jgi:FixJ family two-component response regulator
MNDESRASSSSLVTVVDDERAVRESLSDLLMALGFSVATFSSAESFLRSPSLHQTGCLLLDVAMPGMSGPELMRELQSRQLRIPIAFITAHDEWQPRLLAMGACDCLVKPFSDEALERAVRRALAS